MSNSTLKIFSVPIETETVDKALFFVFSIFIAAFAVVAIRLIVAFVLQLFSGLKKLVYFTYLTYTVCWKISFGIVQFVIFMAIMIVLYYWFIDNNLRSHLNALANIAPHTSLYLELAKNHSSILSEYAKIYLGYNASATT